MYKYDFIVNGETDEIIEFLSKSDEEIIKCIHEYGNVYYDLIRIVNYICTDEEAYRAHEGNRIIRKAIYDLGGPKRFLYNKKFLYAMLSAENYKGFQIYVYGDKIFEQDPDLVKSLGHTEKTVFNEELLIIDEKENIKSYLFYKVMCKLDDEDAIDMFRDIDYLINSNLDEMELSEFGEFLELPNFLIKESFKRNPDNRDEFDRICMYLMTQKNLSKRKEKIKQKIMKKVFPL